MLSQGSYPWNGEARRPRRVILHVIQSLVGGGTERTLVALLCSLDPSRFQHVVVALRSAGALAAGLPDHVACHCLGSIGRARTLGFALAKIVRDQGAEVVHARNTGTWFDATVASTLSAGAKLVLGFHGLETDQGFTTRQRWRARLGLLTGARFTCVSDVGKRQLHDQTGVPFDRIDVLRNGVDLRRFRPPEAIERRAARAALRLGPDDFVVGVVGSLTPVKQHWVLMRAVARVAESAGGVRLLIVGDGPQRSSLTDEAATLGIRDRVIFTGPREDVPSLLHCMDVYVCSSASEGMSNALLEAMAVGLPIVATDVGDHAMIVRDGAAGRIVAPGSVDEIAEALAVLMAGPEVRMHRGVSAGARAATFSFDRTVRAYDAFYGRLTTSRDGADVQVSEALPLHGVV